MDFKPLALEAGGLATVAVDALVMVVAGDAVPSGLPDALARLLKQAVDDGDFAFKAGRPLYAHQVAGVRAARLAVVWGGDGGAAAWRRALAAGIALIKGGGARHMALAMVGGPAVGERHAELVAPCVTDALYQYRATKPGVAAPPALRTVSLLCDTAALPAMAAALRRGQALAAGVELARELGNRPPNHCTPTYLAEQAVKLGREHKLKVEVLERKDCEKLGMGSFLAVARGSDEPPKFIVLHWNGGAKGDAPVVLVGKGITFDSGGISIKPSADMDEMKFDMCGATSVLGTLRALAEMKARVNVVGVIPACENLPSGRAVKPGDVVTSLSGQTIEVLNTDAEGRLILCDALTWAERLAPAVVVDIATLTGACVIALGHHRSGLFSPDEALAAQLLEAGEEALDPAWRMPLDDEYDEALKSNFADMGNVGGRAGGAITAAMFLKRFAGKLRWAHLDIAGTAWKSGAAKGATGRPVPLLTRFVLAHAARVAATEPAGRGAGAASAAPAVTSSRRRSPGAGAARR